MRSIGGRISAGVEGEVLRVCRERRSQAQGDPTTETYATSRAERAATWLRVPLIIAALLAIPTIIIQESDLGRSWNILAAVLDWCIWGMFAANLAIMLVFTPPFLPATMKLARLLPVVRLVWLVVVANRLSNVFSLEGCATRR